MSWKKSFVFGMDTLLVVPYTEYSKFILRNYAKIIEGIYRNIENKYIISTSELKNMDFKLDDERHVKIMLFVDTDTLSEMHWHDGCGHYKDKSINIFCLEENVEIIQKQLPEAICIGVDKENISDLINEKIIIK